MKKFINKVDDIVPEMLQGMELAFPKIVKKINDKDDILIRTTFEKDKVSIISGGGCGHEPAHAGYVGKGMLDAAVCGPIFTSPSAPLVLKAIESVPHEKGVLLIIKSYTGDIMNFTMAEQMAQAEGIKVDHVIVNDDVALLELNDNVQRRGLAGVVLVHKITGAKAETGASLEEVKATAEKVIANVGTYGIGLDGCTVPANGKKGFTLPDNIVEMGLGIHGEPGIRQEPMKTADEFVEEILPKIDNYLKLAKGDKTAVIVNGLGATPMMELDIIARKVLQMLDAKGVKVSKTLVGNYLTSIDMPGMSVTVLKLDDELDKLVHAPALTISLQEQGEE